MSKTSNRIRFIKQLAIEERCEGISQTLAIKDFLKRKLLSKDRLFASERSVSQLNHTPHQDNSEPAPKKPEVEIFDVDLELDSHRDRMADQLKSYDKFTIKSVPLNEKDSHQPLIQMHLEAEQDKDPVPVSTTVSSRRIGGSRSRIDINQRKKIFRDADYWYHKGMSAAKKNKPETAIECYKQALKLVSDINL